MKLRCNIILSIAVTIASVGLILYFVIQSEPAIRGKPLTVWVDQLFRTDRDQAEAAIREIGPKTVPFLLAMAAHRNTPIQERYRTIWPKLPGVLQRCLPKPKPVDHLFPQRIFFALSLLGSQALPNLITGMEHPDSGVRLAAIRAIKSLGAKADVAVPALVKALSDTNAEIRSGAVHALGKLGPRNTTAVAGLIEALKDSDIGLRPGDVVFVREMAAMVLGQMGPEARTAVSGLTAMLEDPHAYARAQAAFALWQIDHSTNTIPMLIAELETAANGNTSTPIGHLDESVCRIVLFTLGAMGPAAEAAVPAILNVISSGFLGSEVQNAAKESLKSIAPEVAAKADVN